MMIKNWKFYYSTGLFNTDGSKVFEIFRINEWTSATFQIYENSFPFETLKPWKRKGAPNFKGHSSMLRIDKCGWREGGGYFLNSEREISQILKLTGENSPISTGQRGRCRKFREIGKLWKGQFPSRVASTDRTNVKLYRLFPPACLHKFRQLWLGATRRKPRKIWWSAWKTVTQEGTHSDRERRKFIRSYCRRLLDILCSLASCFLPFCI